jgi:two-component system response regulator YesN
VLIADDEPLVRFSIRSMLDELELPLMVVAEASNGEELERAVETYRPDIAVVDVRMPGSTGLQAIRRARRSGAKTRWLVLTSHAEFDYASEAIQLGVAGYLLKPAGPEQLKDALIPLIAEIERERAAADEQFVRSLVLGLEASDKGAPPTALPMCWVGVIRVDFGSELTALERVARQDEVVALLRSLSSGDIRLAVWSAGPGSIRIVMTLDEEFTARRDAITAAVKHEPELCWLSGAGVAEISSWSELSGAFARCDDILAYRSVLGTGAFQEAGDWERRLATLSEPLRALGRSLDAFLSAWDEGHAPELLELAGRLIEQFPCAANWDTPARYVAHRTGIAAPQPEMIVTEWVHGFASAARLAVPEVRRAVDAQTRVVDGVDEYLNQHLVDEVRVPDIAAYLALSPNYLSSLYRKTAGVTISERLTELRLTRARELLLSPGNAVKSVAADVGYRSTRHFARLYHQRFGHYPSGR